MSANHIFNQWNGYFFWSRCRKNILQCLICKIGAYFSVCQGRKGAYTSQGALELTDVGPDFSGNKMKYVIGNIDIFRFGFFTKNGNPCFKIRSLYVCYESPFETGPQAVFQSGYFLGRPVG